MSSTRSARARKAGIILRRGTRRRRRAIQRTSEGDSTLGTGERKVRRRNIARANRGIGSGQRRLRWRGSIDDPRTGSGGARITQRIPSHHRKRVRSSRGTCSGKTRKVLRRGTRSRRRSIERTKEGNSALGAREREVRSNRSTRASRGIRSGQCRLRRSRAVDNPGTRRSWTRIPHGVLRHHGKRMSRTRCASSGNTD